MKRPATSTIVAFVAVLLVVAVVAAIVGFGTDGPTAIRVGDQTMSAADVNEELEAVVDNEGLAQEIAESGGQVSATAGSIRSGGSAGLVTIMVYGMLFDQALERAGEPVTAADRAEAEDAVQQQFGGAYSEFPRWLRERLERRFGFIVAAQRVSEVDATFAQRAARQTEVSIDPVYGRWAPAQLQVVPYPTPLTPAQG